MAWFQHTVTIRAPQRGFHLISNDILKQINPGSNILPIFLFSFIYFHQRNLSRTDLKKIRIGMANIFLQHTSASLTINENADPDVRKDMEYISNKIAPEVRPEIY